MNHSPSQTPPLTWAPGAIVPGTVYRIIRPLGSGGMGDVYEAEHELLGVRRALKVLSRKLADRGDLSARLRVEARALASLRHPNLVEVHDLGISADGRVFFAMELLVGSTLRDLLRDKGRLKVDQAVRIASELLDALGAAHERGMIHRDVKPENVFLLANGTVKLLDFGVAKAVQGAPGHALTAAGVAVGTPRYMAPEQAEGHPVDARADLYAVGVVLWEMLVGRPPFAEHDAIAAAVAAVTKGVPPLDQQGIDVPPAIVDAVRRATSRSREERHPTAAAFSAELRLAGARASLASLPPGVDKPTLRYENAPTSLVPIIDPSAHGGGDEATAVDAAPYARTEAPIEETLAAASVPTDRRNLPTPTSIPEVRRPAQASAQPETVPTAAARPRSRPVLLFAAIPLTALLSVATTLAVLHRGSVRHEASEPVGATTTTTAPPQASASAAAVPPAPSASAVAAPSSAAPPPPPPSASAPPPIAAKPEVAKAPKKPSSPPMPVARPASRSLPGSGL